MNIIDTHPYKNRWIILAVVVLAPFMSTLDSSIVNVALPKMTSTLSVSMASIEWVITSYLIVISSTILLFGRLGDIRGKSVMFKWGFLIFTIGSLFCGLAPNFPMLILARCIQAIGAAGTMANSQGIITQVFPQSERGRALGISGTAVALGTMVGPPLGGFITQFLHWHYIFLVNVPIGVIAVTACTKLLPKSSRSNEKLDLVGAALFALSIVSLFYALINGQVTGYAHSKIILCFLLGFLFLVVFLLFERKIEKPLLDLSIFKNSLFSLSLFTGFMTFLALSSTNILQPFYLQNVLKLDPAKTGLIMMASPIVLAIVAPASGFLSDKIGSEFLTFVGLFIAIISFLMMATLNVSTPIYVLLLFISIMSLGNGLFQSPNNSLVMSTVSRDKLGIAGSINGFVRNLGLVSGIAISTSILYAMMSAKLGHRVTGFVPGKSEAFVYGMKYAYLTAAAFCTVGEVLTGIRLLRKHRSKN